MQQLEAFKQRITAVQDQLEKEEFDLGHTCYEIINIGVQIQRVSTVVRPHTVEGQEKRKLRNLNAKFQRHLEKNKNDVKWIKENCMLTKHRHVSKKRIDGALPITNVTPKEFVDNSYTWARSCWVCPTKKWLKEND